MVEKVNLEMRRMVQGIYCDEGIKTASYFQTERDKTNEKDHIDFVGFDVDPADASNGWESKCG